MLNDEAHLQLEKAEGLQGCQHQEAKDETASSFIRMQIQKMIFISDHQSVSRRT